MALETTDDKSNLKELWMLLFENPRSLDDEQITCLLEAEKELGHVLDHVYHWFPEEFRRLQRYHRKKNELSQLSMEELMERSQGITKQRTSILRSVPDEELSDSFFEAPSLDSDEHILYEILRERFEKLDTERSIIES